MWFIISRSSLQAFSSTVMTFESRDRIYAAYSILMPENKQKERILHSTPPFHLDRKMLCDLI